MVTCDKCNKDKKNGEELEYYVIMPTNVKQTSFSAVRVTYQRTSSVFYWVCEECKIEYRDSYIKMEIVVLIMFSMAWYLIPLIFLNYPFWNIIYIIIHFIVWFIVLIIIILLIKQVNRNPAPMLMSPLIAKEKNEKYGNDSWAVQYLLPKEWEQWRNIHKY